jgi:sugar phosphate isomerase/epimerase
MANDLSAQVVTIHPGPSLSTLDRDLLLTRLADAYVALQAEAGSLTVAVENMPYSRGVTQEAVSSTTDFQRLLEMIPHMAFTLDIGHAQQSRDSDYLSFLRTTSASIANIHLHDALVGGRAHLPLGDGEVDVDAVGKTLLDIGFRGYLALETLGSDDTERSWSRLSVL